MGIVALLAYVGCVFGANWAGERYGIVPIGFGLEGPAGLYFVGMAFGLRDIVRESLGKWWVAGAVVVGAVLSYFVAPSFALASGVAFLVSESADAVVYEPLRRKGWSLAVIASNVVGAVVDSVLFLWIAFGWQAVGDFWLGQTVGKTYMVLPALVVMWGWRNSDLLVRPRPA